MLTLEILASKSTDELITLLYELGLGVPTASSRISADVARVRARRKQDGIAPPTREEWLDRARKASLIIGLWVSRQFLQESGKYFVLVDAKDDPQIIEKLRRGAISEINFALDRTYGDVAAQATSRNFGKPCFV